MTIRISTDVRLGRLEIEGQTAGEVLTNLKQLVGSADLLLTWGNVVRELNASESEIEALGAVGSELGGQQIGEAEVFTWETGVTVATPHGFQQAQRYTAVGDNGQQVRAMWWGSDSNLPVTDNPVDPGIAEGTKRFWRWF